MQNFDSVSLVKEICKERKIPISKLESDCGFSNAYIRGLKEGKFPADRMMIIADYLKLPIEYLTTGKKPEIPIWEPEHLELIELYSKLKTEQKSAILNLLRSFAL